MQPLLKTHLWGRGSSRLGLRLAALLVLFMLLALMAAPALADTVTTTIGAGSRPFAVAVNPVTNKIYVANWGSANVTVIDGATNVTSTVGAETHPLAMAVNPVTNKIYVANYFSASVTVIAEQLTQAIPEFVSIQPLAKDQATTSTPAFTFIPNSYYSPIAPIVKNIYYQVDTWQNAWSKANSSDGATWTGISPVLGAGVHIVYAWAGDGSEATSINAPLHAPRSPSSPIIGQIAAYLFVVVPSGSVNLSTASLTFSSQPVGTTSSAQDVTLSNTGNGALTIGNMSTTADFAQANNCGTSLAAGGSCTIHVTFTPSASGLRNGTLAISDSAGGSPRIVNLSGTGTAPAVSLSANTLTFADQPVGTTSTAQGVTLTNNGTASLAINNISVIGDFAQTNNCGSSLAASANCTINVTFAPGSPGARNGMLAISDSAGGGSTQTVALSGTGNTATVSLSPNVLNFGNQQVGTTTAAQAATITNPGNAALTITSITASPDFSQTNDCGSSLAPSDRCTIHVTFTPSVASVRLGTLTIADNASGSPHLLNLVGTGTTSPVLAPGSLTFDTQVVGTASVAQAVTITNVGGAILEITNVATSGDFAQTNTCMGHSLNVGSSCGINVLFKPTAGGLRAGTVTITYRGSDSPATVSLSGTGKVQLLLPLIVR